ncbi:phage portal protein [Streptomyces sp. ME18-1-4]|uniref:phage portal protein n=1 Tax=Streptomyces sp. ME18-1-4 TaxID=3028685 RepID=UPI0029B1CEBC|nr:phage portal protein [Streptomyces sp. ME18-1-4]MDX3245839.1 phage portal protein [Streptomyces sp. ME18-1-4]
MGLRSWIQSRRAEPEVLERAAARPNLPERTGYEYGIGPGGLTETNQGLGAGTQTDRRTTLDQLYQAYMACPWSWASVNAIARTITAGGLVTDWDNDDGEGDEETPDKPSEVKLLENMLAYCNPRENIRQILRSVVVDLLVFGDAYIEVVWVGSQPVALYSLDCPSMLPVADEHGNVTKYVQVTELGQRAEFEPREVIHISLDSPRSSVFGVSPTQAALLPITAWLFAAATTKEIFRKGAPPQLWVDHPASAAAAEINRWNAQYQARNVGPRNIGNPINTKGGAKVEELAQSRTMDYLKFLEQKRDEIIASYGVPPAKVGIIESGNLGGGTGEAQDRTFMINTCQPIAELVLEALNFALSKQGFGVQGWKLKFRDIDMRDSKTVEEIRDTRLRNGSWSLNRYRADIGEPAVDGGDQPILVDRQNLTKWADMDAASKANIASKLKGTDLTPADPVHGEPLAVEKPEPAPVPSQLVPFAAGAPPGTDDGAPDDESPAESARDLYRRRLLEALAALPGGVDERAAA